MTVAADFALVVNATRYCLGRQSYAPSEHIHWLTTHWTALDERTRLQVLADVREALDRDTRYAEQGLYTVLGWTRPDWERIAALGAA